MPDQQTPPPQRFSISDPYRAVPLYVSGMTVSHHDNIRMLFVAFFSGMPLPLGPEEYALHESLVGAYALDPIQAKFLYQNLKQFLESIGEEV